MRISVRTGFGLAIVLALLVFAGCTKKHIYSEPGNGGRTEQAQAPQASGQVAGQAAEQGTYESVEILTMGEELPGESGGQPEPMAQPGLVENTYSNEPAPVTPEPVTPESVTPEPVTPEPQAQPVAAASGAAPPASVNVDDPMSPEAMAEEPMPFEPPDKTLADPGHETAATSAATSVQPAVQPAAEPAVAAAESVYDQVGLGSWVADSNKGLPTASGELYDPSDLTAAHRTYPLNTRLKVTNLETGQSVVVRINDRGPFKKERIVDLSRAAAQEIGMTDQGTAQVGVSVVDEAPSVQPVAPAGGGYYVQVGAYGSRAAADAVLDKLVRAGYAESRVVKASNETVYRVQAGSFQSESESRDALGFLSGEFPGSFVVTK